MLKRVGNPVAINPTNELVNRMIEDETLYNKSQIIVERKRYYIFFRLQCKKT